VPSGKRIDSLDNIRGRARGQRRRCGSECTFRSSQLLSPQDRSQCCTRPPPHCPSS
jgi:hypothetical protein